MVAFSADIVESSPPMRMTSPPNGMNCLLVFSPGFSTSAFVTDVSGRGVGLDVIRENVERLKGNIQLESSHGEGCTLRMLLPISLATARVLIARCASRSYALPVESVLTSRYLSSDGVYPIEARETIVHDGRPVPIAPLSHLLEIEDPGAAGGNGGKGADGRLLCVILESGSGRCGVLVDDLVEEREVVVKPHSPILKRVRNVTGTTILETGEVCIILNAQDLIRAVEKRVAPAPVGQRDDKPERQQVVLLVEDSITTRVQEKRILEAAGYEVVEAVDGLEAMNKLASQPIDAVVSDVVMPNLDGLALTAKIRQDAKFAELPVVLVTTLSTDDDKRRGLEAGANAYITKPRFDQKVLTETLRRLI